MPHIKSKTVFVLGAGASVGYGYPTGLILKNRVIDEIVKQKGVFHDLTVRGLESPQIPIQTKLHELAQILPKSRVTSIDHFLQHRGSKFEGIGKMVIASILSRQESSRINCI